MARETRFDIGTTYYLPDAPQQRPFLGVITDACNWSKGTSQYGAVEAALTTGLYNCGYIIYGATGFTGFNPNAATPTGETFYLTKYLYARPMHLTAACYDISNYLLCCTNAMGLQCTCDLINNHDMEHMTVGQGFICNPIFLIGTNPDDGNSTPQFYNHQVLIDKGGNICDASLAMLYDLAGNQTKGGIIPIAWPLVNYWQTASSCLQCPTETTGLVHLPEPSAPNIMINHFIPVISTSTNIIG